ncbi:MAG: MalY/PatB family protein [Deltaproteobacteria bacterium]
MDFDEIIDRRGTHSVKWDMMEKNYGVSPDDGLSMWVADMDFRPPTVVQSALETLVKHGIYGYFGDDRSNNDAIRWWMKTRYGWDVSVESIFTTHGLVNGTSLCLDAFTKPGDGVILTTPVYHAFARVTKASGREVVECPLALSDGRYEMDFATWDAQMKGHEKLFILCSPHNPGGRVWTRKELQGVADFCIRHDLILISDEIHHDLIISDAKHTPMSLIDGIADRLVMMTATTKTFNIAGAHIGNVIIEDPVLRQKFAGAMNAMGISPNLFGMIMSTAAYSPEGAVWVDALNTYLRGNAEVLDRGLAAIPGVHSMPLEATYLSWVDFKNLGMADSEIKRRIEREAKIAVNYGATFGKGGESFMRFNIATPRARIIEAVERLHRAFGDLQ